MFKLLKLKLLDHPVLKNCELEFIDLDNSNHVENIQEPFTTVIIGPNGAGKSKLLRAVIEIFREISDSKSPEGKVRPKVGFKFELSYKLDNDIFVVKRVGEGRELYKNNKAVNISEIIVPAKLLASSFMLNDSFLFANNESDGIKEHFYEYLGVRATPRTASTQSYQRKIIEAIIEASSKSEFFNNLRVVLRFLDFNPEYFAVSFSIRYRFNLFNKLLSNEDFISFFKDWKRRRTSEPYSLAYFNKLSSNDIEGIVGFINQIHPYIQRNKGSYFIQYELLSDKTGADKLSSAANSIRHLYKLDIITYPAILVKKDSVFDLQGTSSGEYHFLSTIVGLLAKVQQNSLVLIDEPEISLHPSWQTKYIEILKNVFSKFASCHFLIATHSHFILSDLKPNSSSVIGLRRVDGEVISELQRMSTYGWSSEDVLYNIFNLATTRNYFFIKELGDTLALISRKDHDATAIKEKISKLMETSRFLKNTDPLKEVIDDLAERFGK